MGWIVSPEYALSEKIFRVCYWALSRYAPQLIVKAQYSSSGMEIHTTLGSHLFAKTAENPTSLIGEGLNFLICDEAARIKDQVWDSALRPALADKRGWGVFISTPKGTNWFKSLHTRGSDPLQPLYKSFNFPSGTNPYLDKEEIAQARLTTPERIFRQEWLAEFIDDVGGVFRRVTEAIRGNLEVESAGDVVIGIDLAKHEDFTVVIVVDRRTKNVIFFDRFNQLDWSYQMNRIINIVTKFNRAHVIIDSTGVGDSVYDLLRVALGQYSTVRLSPFLITGANKKELIDNLAIAIENKEVGYPLIPELVSELQIYSYTMSPSRNITYGAPAGYHDDCVIALALAYTGIKRGVSGGLAVYGVKSKY